MFNNVFSKIVPFMEELESYCKAGQYTIDNMAHALFKMDTYSHKTHSEYVTRTSFPLQDRRNAPQCYVMHTLLLLL
jgi:hypothetical protein